MHATHISYLTQSTAALQFSQSHVLFFAANKDEAQWRQMVVIPHQDHCGFTHDGHYHCGKTSMEMAQTPEWSNTSGRTVQSHSLSFKISFTL